MTSEQAGMTKDNLEAMNYQDISFLKKENRKTIHKMTKYIYTFPLSPVEIEQIRRDIIGMAMEAEKRGESLSDVLGKKPREFCNDLIYAIGGIRSPGGRRMLVVAAAYFQIVGFIGIVSNLIYVFSILMTGTMAIFIDTYNHFEISEFWYGLFLLAISILYYKGGSYALKSSNNSEKAKTALYWGIGLLLINVLQMLIPDPNIGIALNNTLINIITIIVSILFNIGFPLLYILGAWRNRPVNQS